MIKNMFLKNLIRTSAIMAIMFGAATEALNASNRNPLTPNNSHTQPNIGSSQLGQSNNVANTSTVSFYQVITAPFRAIGLLPNTTSSPNSTSSSYYSDSEDDDSPSISATSRNNNTNDDGSSSYYSDSEDDDSPSISATPRNNNTNDDGLYNSVRNITPKNISRQTTSINLNNNNDGFGAFPIDDANTKNNDDLNTFAYVTDDTNDDGLYNSVRNITPKNISRQTTSINLNNTNNGFGAFPIDDANTKNNDDLNTFADVTDDTNDDGLYNSVRSDSLSDRTDDDDEIFDEQNNIVNIPGTPRSNNNDEMHVSPQNNLLNNPSTRGTTSQYDIQQSQIQQDGQLARELDNQINNPAPSGKAIKTEKAFLVRAKNGSTLLGGNMKTGAKEYPRRSNGLGAFHKKK